MARLPWRLAGGVLLAGFAGWAVLATGRGVLALGAATLQALWLVPALVALHLTQLLISARAWQILLPGPARLALCFRLRVVREGIDSLLPVAQIGGEVVGARLLAAGGPPLAVAGASVVVDVTLEFLAQIAFLLVGLAALATVAPGAWQAWTGAALVTAAMAAGLLAAQRFGLLRALEAVARQIATRWPGAAAMEGMNAAAAATYRRRGALAASWSWHVLAWLLGSVESWAVLHALGLDPDPMQAVAVEALGMAARSAGFAVPGALVVQETGFALAAMAVGLPQEAGLSLSLVKRVREVTVGLIGMALWRLGQR